MTSSTVIVALGPRLQLDEHASLVRAAGRVVPHLPDVHAGAGDVRVLQQDVGHLQLMPHHLVEADALCALRC